MFGRENKSKKERNSNYIFMKIFSKFFYNFFSFDMKSNVDLFPSFKLKISFQVAGHEKQKEHVLIQGHFEANGKSKVSPSELQRRTLFNTF